MKEKVTKLARQGAAATNKVKQNQARSEMKKVKLDYESYRPPLKTSIPDELIDWFEENGFSWKWCRVLKENKQGNMVEDTENIAKKKASKFTFVTHEEINNAGFSGISEMWDTADKEYGRLKGTIVAGDLALMKRPMDVTEGHKQFNTREAWNQIKAANDMAGLRTQMSQHGTGGDDLLVDIKSTFGKKRSDVRFKVDAPIESEDEE